MIRTDSSCTDPAILSLWRRHFGSQFRRRCRRCPRPMAALVYYPRGPVIDGLIDLRRLEIWILHDVPSSSRTIRHRLACYRAVPIRWGVLLGGAAQIRFEKDLALVPGLSSPGRRLSTVNERLITWALQLDRYLERHARYPYFPRCNTPRMPQFLVTLNGDQPQGDGPEFEAFHEKASMDAQQARVRFRRLHCRQWLYPLEFVSHAGQRFQSVYVDLKTIPKRQVIRLDGNESLVGYRGACQYDLLNSRFQGRPW